MTVRVALTGASGTGKTTIANFIQKQFGLEYNPVGSRSVAKEMGFESPYDVDKAGKRNEFQRRLLDDKIAWEKERESFVTDRTTLDNLVYSMLHNVQNIDSAFLKKAVTALHRYTHVIYFPFDAFCEPAGDATRVADLTYHELYDFALWGLIDRYIPKNREQRFMVLDQAELAEREYDVLSLLKGW